MAQRCPNFPFGRTSRCGARGCSTAAPTCPCAASPCSSPASRSAVTRRRSTAARATPAGRPQRCGGRCSTRWRWGACTQRRTAASCGRSTTSRRAPCRTPWCTACAGPAPSARSTASSTTAASAPSPGEQTTKARSPKHPPNRSSCQDLAHSVNKSKVRACPGAPRDPLQQSCGELTKRSPNHPQNRTSCSKHQAFLSVNKSLIISIFQP